MKLRHFNKYLSNTQIPSTAGNMMMKGKGPLTFKEAALCGIVHKVRGTTEPAWEERMETDKTKTHQL
jgi:hypothetical protein